MNLMRIVQILLVSGWSQLAWALLTLCRRMVRWITGAIPLESGRLRLAN